jgi:nuclear transport factor 2 (NTF2) superfamily protein
MRDTARVQVKAAQHAWKSRDPALVAQASTEHAE